MDRFAMDPMMRALKAVHSVVGNESGVSDDLEHQRASQERFCRLVTRPIGLSIESLQVQGIPVEWIRPDFAHDSRHVILYCHGGGYTCGGLNYARVLGEKLAHATGLEVVTFAYRLAPEAPYPAAIQDGIAVWNHLMYLGYGAGNILVAGDSAGGNLALELCLHLRKEKRKMPKALLLFSPWTDMTATSSTYRTWKDKDPLLTIEYVKSVREAYAGAGADYADPKYSPLYADLTGMPSSFIQVGSNEILRGDSELLAKKLRSFGVFAKLEVYKGGWHVFQQIPTSLAAKAMHDVHDFVENILR